MSSTALVPRACLTVLFAALASCCLAADDIPSAADACAPGEKETTPSEGFGLMEDGAVVRHEETTLEWRRCTEGQRWDAEANGCRGRAKSVSWEKARELAEKAGGDWRLPSGEELLTIVERCHFGPAINPQVFPNTPSGLFWSSSTDTGGLDRAWCVSFFGGQYYRAGKTQSGRVRLVRGEMQPPQAP